MTHPRTLLRRAARTLLEAEAPFDTARHVLSSAVVDKDTPPCFSVSTPGEDEIARSATETEVRTNLVIAATIFGEAATIEDDLDDLSEQIRERITGGLGAATGAQNVQLKRTETKTGPETRRITGSVMMLFEVVGYFTET